VETPEAFILADEEYHIDTGSSLSLVCIIEKATRPPAYVFWYHNDRMVNYDSERGISVSTTPGRRTHSQLSIKKAVVSDSGNYTCAPARSLPASIQVFVAGSEVKPWTSGGSSTFDYHGQLTTAITFNLAAILASALHCSILSISGYPAGTWRCRRKPQTSIADRLSFGFTTMLLTHNSRTSLLYNSHISTCHHSRISNWSMIFYVIEARRKRIIGLNGSLLGLILQVNAIFNSFIVVL